MQIVPNSDMVGAEAFLLQLIPVDPKSMRRGFGSSAVSMFPRRCAATKIMTNNAILLLNHYLGRWLCHIYLSPCLGDLSAVLTAVCMPRDFGSLAFVSKTKTQNQVKSSLSTPVERQYDAVSANKMIVCVSN